MISDKINDWKQAGFWNAHLIETRLEEISYIVDLSNLGLNLKLENSQKLSSSDITSTEMKEESSPSEPEQSSEPMRPNEPDNIVEAKTLDSAETESCPPIYDCLPSTSRTNLRVKSKPNKPAEMNVFKEGSALGIEKDLDSAKTESSPPIYDCLPSTSGTNPRVKSESDKLAEINALNEKAALDSDGERLLQVILQDYIKLALKIEPDEYEKCGKAGPSSVDGTTLHKLKKNNSNHTSPHELKENNTHRSEHNYSKRNEVGGIVYGFTNAKPISSLNEIDLPIPLIDWSKCDITELSPCQTIFIPIVMERTNCVLIGSRSSKKTSCGLIPLINLMLDDSYYDKLGKGNGPIGVVVAPNETRVRDIAFFCDSLNPSKLSIFAPLSGGFQYEIKSEVPKCCDLLITTPRCWLRLLKNTNVTNLLRLCHVMFDSIDLLLKLFSPEIREIFMNIEKMKLYRTRFLLKYDVQLILIGKTWTETLEKLIKEFLKKPAICFMSFLEAALHSKLKPKVSFVHSSDKMSKISAQIKNSQFRTVVVCNNVEEVNKVGSELSIHSTTLIAHDQMNQSDLQEVQKKWTTEKLPLLVCLDKVICDLNISNAQHIIHYSLPLSIESFSDRFYLIKDHFQDKIKNPKARLPNCTVNILIDESFPALLPVIINYYDRLMVEVPEELRDTIFQIELAKEQCRTDVTLCHNILQFGICWKRERCPFNHLMNIQRDKPNELPGEGYVKVKILHIHDATRTSVQLMSTSAHASSVTDLLHTTWTPFPSNYSEIETQMHTYYQNPDNRQKLGLAKVGGYVAIPKPNFDCFVRGKILEIIKRDDNMVPTEVTVSLIDSGNIICFQVLDLYTLPLEIQKYRADAVDMYIADLEPVDLDYQWNHGANVITQYCLGNADPKSTKAFFVAKVKMAIGSSIIVESLQWYEELDEMKTVIIKRPLRHLLLKSKLAINCSAHVKTLEALMLQAGLKSNKDIGKQQHMSSSTSIDEMPRWAELPKGQLVEVYLPAAESPSLLFIRRKGFDELLLNLHKKLSGTLNTKSSRLKFIQIGTVCAAKSDGEWCRAMVVDMGTTTNSMHIFFVDYGDLCILQAEDLCYLPPKYIRMLPFQAIECELIGIKPACTRWDNDAIDMLLNATEANGYWRKLTAQVCETHSDTVFTRGLHYKIILAVSDDIDFSINAKIVNKGYGNWNEDKHYICNPLSCNKNLPSQSDPKNTPNHDDLSKSADNFEISEFETLDELSVACSNSIAFGKRINMKH